jgi:hypothetical protein
MRISDVSWLGEFLHHGRHGGGDAGRPAVRRHHAERQPGGHTRARGVHAFVTPVLVHFGGVLFLSMDLLAPWPAAWPLGLVLGLHGLAGIVYASFVIRLLRRLDFVSLDARDWIAYAGAPALANVSLLVGAAGLVTEKSFAPYAVAGAVMLLLFVGILDAWDLTLWIVRNRETAHQAAIDG